MSSYYKIALDSGLTDLWHIALPWNDRGEKVVAGAFSLGNEWGTDQGLHSEILTPGVPASMTLGLAGYFVRADIASLLKAVCPESIQTVPVEIKDVHDRYEMLNVLDIVDCVDEQRSEFTKWTIDDGRPDKIGDYRMSKLVLDRDRVQGHHLFRVKGWRVDLICSEMVRSILARAGVTGVVFRPVETN